MNNTGSSLSVKSLFICSGLLGSLVSAVSAAELTGYVTDKDSGTSLEGVTVTIPGLDITATTNRRGYFSFNDLEAGKYTVSFRYVGAETTQMIADVSDTKTAVLSAELGTTVYVMDDFVVESGYLSSTNRALNLQRTSENLVEVVASDFFGRFADSNAAEALNRVAGVSIERDQGEGRFVIIRGIDPNLNSVAIDGISLAAPSEDDRSTLLDTIPIDVLDTLEVTKAVTPDQPGDSIGGYINLRSPSAFNFGGRAVHVNGSVLYSDLVDETGYKFNGSYSDLFGENDQWGLHLSFINSERTFGSDNVESDEWVEEGASFVPDDTIEYREYDLVRERTGVTANLEFQPNEDNLFFIRTSYNNYRDTETRDRANIIFEGNFSGVGQSTFTNDDVSTEVELKEREENMRLFVVSAGAEHTISDWMIDYSVALSTAEEDTPYDREVIYESSNSSTATVTGADSYTPGLSASQGGNDYTDASTFDFDELTIGKQLVEETDLSARANIKREFDTDLVKYIKFGGMGRLKNKESDFDQISADTDTGIETADKFQLASSRNPFRRRVPGLSTSIFRFAQSNLPFSKDTVDSQIEDYETDEDVFAGYFMTSLDLEEWNFIVGARVEHTRFETDGYKYNEDTDVVSDVSFENDYTNFLPGIHMKREITENLILRASWTNTIARPTFEQSKPGVTREGNEVERGNPDLDPYEASNLDMSFQYYSETYGNFSASVFYKDIENFIYAQTFSEGTDEVTTFLNGESGEILGLELSYSKQLNFLPGLLSGLHFSSNVTFSDSEADAARPDGGAVETTPFVKQSDVIGNVSLSWEYERFFIRVSGSYRDDYLDELGEEAFQDRYVDDFFQIDLYSSVRLTDGLSVFVEVNNLNDEPFRAYWGESGRLSQYEEYGVSGSLGAKWTF